MVLKLDGRTARGKRDYAGVQRFIKPPFTLQTLLLTASMGATHREIYYLVIGFCPLTLTRSILGAAKVVLYSIRSVP
jgi:hypothetical protein